MNWQLLKQHEIEIRVRYQETDAQGRVHHANYLTWFEIGRVELIRAGGLSYRELEAQGLMLVLSEIQCRYHSPASFDDLLRLRTTTVKARGARLENKYELFRGDELLAEGRSIVACVGRDGRVQRLPDWLQLEGPSEEECRRSRS